MFWLVSNALSAPLQDGDLVFHRSSSEQAAFLELATGSSLTHVGVVTVRGGVPYVLEAVEPVKVTPLREWADRAADGRIAVKRLADAERLLTPAARAKMEVLGRSWLGVHYDAGFAWSDDRLYCSELVHKLFLAIDVTLGTPHPMGDFALSDPRVRAAAAKRFGGPVPVDEPVVAPVDLYDDLDLVTVCEGPVGDCLP